MHNPTVCFCGHKHPADERFFVTMTFQGQVIATLLGPYLTHAEAHAKVDCARRLVVSRVPWTETDCDFQTAGADDAASIAFFASVVARLPWNAVTGDRQSDTPSLVAGLTRLTMKQV